MAQRLRLRNSARIRTALFFNFFLITITTSYILTGSYFVSLEKYQILLEAVDQNINTANQLVVYANQLARDKASVRPAIDEATNSIDLNLNILNQGGVYEFNRQSYELPPCDPNLTGSLTEIYKVWKEFKKQIEQIRRTPAFIQSGIISIPNPSMQNQLNTLENLLEELTVASNKFKRGYSQISEEKKDNANNLLLVLFLINLGFIAFGLLLLRWLIFLPLKRVTSVAELIADGDLSRKIDLQTENEVGLISDALNRLIDKIRDATDFIRTIEEGNLDVEYTSDESIESDTLALALIEMRERMKQVASQERERSWVTEGLAKFAEILQTHNNNTERLAYEIIANIVRYTNATQGALFVVNRDDPQDVHLSLAAAYAYERRKYRSKRIDIGETLAGQAYKDMDTIYLTEIPENYVEISSGMGGARPRCLLIIPLKINEIAYGIIELASFQEFKPYEIEFLERLGENVAATLNSTQSNERTKALLEESNAITLQMQEQEREMARNLEQLQRAQEEMRKNEEILSAQSYTLQNTLINAELDMQGRIITVNKLFLDTMGIKESAESLVGRDYRTFIPAYDEYAVREFEEIWDLLKNGKPASGSYKRLASNGMEKWIRATYSPINDKNGKPYKVIKAGFDVTLEKNARLDFQQQLDSFRRFNAVVEFDVEGNFLEVNEIFTQIMGYTKAELVGRPHTLVVPPEEAESEEFKELWARLQRGEFYSAEMRRITKYGEEVWLQGSFNPILDNNGKPYKIIEFIIDITERKKAEKAIIASQRETESKESNLRAIINNTDEIIITMNSQLLISGFNEKARATYEDMGIQLANGLPISETFPKNKTTEFEELYQRCLNGEKFSIEEFIHNYRTHTASLYEMTFYPTTDAQGAVNGVAMFAKDLTEIRKKEKEFDKLQRQVKTQRQSIEKLEKTRSELRKELKAKEEELQQVQKSSE